MFVLLQEDRFTFLDKVSHIEIHSLLNLFVGDVLHDRLAQDFLDALDVLEHQEVEGNVFEVLVRVHLVFEFQLFLISFDLWAHQAVSLVLLTQRLPCMVVHV